MSDKKKHWRCPHCGNQLTTFVGLSCPPQCGNPKVHSSKLVVMEQVKKLIAAS